MEPVKENAKGNICITVQEEPDLGFISLLSLP